MEMALDMARVGKGMVLGMALGMAREWLVVRYQGTALGMASGMARLLKVENEWLWYGMGRFGKGMSPGMALGMAREWLEIWLGLARNFSRYG